MLIRWLMLSIGRRFTEVVSGLSQTGVVMSRILSSMKIKPLLTTSDILSR
jgi:hypothetical protein